MLDRDEEIKNNRIRFIQKRVSKLGYLKKTIVFFIASFLMFYVTLCIWLLLCSIFKQIYQLGIVVSLLEIIIIGISMFASNTLSNIFYNFNSQLLEQRMNIFFSSVFIGIIIIVNIILYKFNIIIPNSDLSADLSLKSLLISYILITCFSITGIWLTQLSIFLPPMVIDIKNQKNMYINSTGQICITNGLSENNEFEFQVNQIKEGEYKYKYCGVIPWRDRKEFKHGKIEKFQSTILKNLDISSELYPIKIDDFINKFKSPLGLIENEFYIVIEYRRNTEKNSHYVLENVLLLDKHTKESNSQKDTNDIIHSWTLQEILVPFLFSAGFSSFVVALYVIFHKWYEFKILQQVELQICWDLKDTSEINIAYAFVLIGFACIYASILLKYILRMIVLKDSMMREVEYHNYVIKIIEGALLILPVLLLRDQPLDFDYSGYLKLNFNLILCFWILVTWLFFNIIKGISILKKWIMKDKESKGKFPRTYLLLSVISFLLGMLFKK